MRPHQRKGGRCVIKSTGGLGPDTGTAEHRRQTKQHECQRTTLPKNGVQPGCINHEDHLGMSSDKRIDLSIGTTEPAVPS